ncbi:MAG: hypothetical protein QM702_00175 [Rubrivivax sp.]
MTPDTLRAAGELLYGPRWQSDLARALGVGDRRIREWMAEERSIPAGVGPEIAALWRDRVAAGATLLPRLENAA